MTTFRQPGTVLTDHVFSVPLDHDAMDGPRIGVFGREVVAAEQAGRDDLPWLVFLQGGPGSPAQRPVGREGWLDRALRDYRVLLLDQRGTGRSAPANRTTLAGLGDAHRQASYLRLFRADSIVRDCEWIRRLLLGDRPWSVLGQSFGGFCAVSYLSLAPEGMAEAFITGGLPGLRASADDVYRLTYRQVERKNEEFYRRYCGDVELVHRIVTRLWEDDVRLPSGRPVDVRAFQTLGRMLGDSMGFHRLHYLLESAFLDGDKRFSDTFLAHLEATLSLAAMPLYAVLHEACYAQGSATRWSAARIRAEFPEFDAGPRVERGLPVLFTGEMIYPETVADDPALRPLEEAAALLAEYEDWPTLYDPERLAGNTVPAAAAVYVEDMYVPYELSAQTARGIGGLRAWVTNEFEHDGLRSGGVLDGLISRVRGG